MGTLEGQEVEESTDPSCPSGKENLGQMEHRDPSYG